MDVRAQGHPLQALVVLVSAVVMGVALMCPHQRQQRGGRLSSGQRQRVQRKILEV